MPKLYKITGPNGEAINGGSGSWNLPRGSRPGQWMPKVAKVRACRSGYHLIPAKAIFDWLPSAPGVLWEAEGRSDHHSDGDKIAFAEARLIKKIGVLDDVSMRLAAADIAARVLPIFEKKHPNDNRPRLAIQAARDFALSKIDAAAEAAVGDAAWAAARAAAEAAARAAAGAAAWAAVGDAARAAAWAAAEAAAGDAAWDANSRTIIKQARARMKELSHD